MLLGKPKPGSLASPLFGSSGGMPIRLACLTMASGPLSMLLVRSMNAVLIDSSVALIRLTGAEVLVALVLELGVTDLDRRVAVEGVLELEALADPRR